MAEKSSLFEDAQRVVSGAAGTVSGLRQQIRADLRERMEEMARRANLASREEVSDVEALAAHARDAQEQILERLDAIEKRLEALEQKQSAPAKRSQASKQSGNAKSSTTRKRSTTTGKATKSGGGKSES